MHIERTFEIAAIVIIETDRAILVDVGDDEQWIPKSQIHDDSEVYESGNAGTLIVSEWIAKQKGWL